jgi:hypothetical protein
VDRFPAFSTRLEPQWSRLGSRYARLRCSPTTARPSRAARPVESTSSSRGRRRTLGLWPLGDDLPTGRSATSSMNSGIARRLPRPLGGATTTRHAGPPLSETRSRHVFRGPRLGFPARDSVDTLISGEDRSPVVSFSCGTELVDSPDQLSSRRTGGSRSLLTGSGRVT